MNAELLLLTAAIQTPSLISHHLVAKALVLSGRTMKREQSRVLAQEIILNQAEPWPLRNMLQAPWAKRFWKWYDKQPPLAPRLAICAAAKLLGQRAPRGLPWPANQS